MGDWLAESPIEFVHKHTAPPLPPHFSGMCYFPYEFFSTNSLFAAAQIAIYSLFNIHIPTYIKYIQHAHNFNNIQREKHGKQIKLNTLALYL